MLFWSLAIVMLAVAALMVLWPLQSREEKLRVDPRRAVLVEQLREIESQSDASADRENERARVGRQIMALDDNSTQGHSERRSLIVASCAALIVVPATVVPLYLALGTPSAATISREAVALESQSLAEMVATAEGHLRDNPDDVQGWTVLARVYGSQGRATDRIRALENLLRLQPENPNLKADLAQDLAQASGNVIPNRAVGLLDNALQLDPTHEKASFFRALAYEQAGDDARALSLWQKLANIRPEDELWQNEVAARIDALSSATSSLDTDTARAIQEAPAEQREAMIRGMVEGLASRLADEPDDLQGWQRLMRAYTVLGTPDAALAALDLAIAAEPDTSALKPKLVALRNSARESR